MKSRKLLNARRSQKLFTKTAKKKNPRNMRTIPRGGTRL